MLDYDAHDATALAALVARREVSPTELLDAALAAMGRVNGDLNAVVVVSEDVARAKIAEGLPAGPLTGVPFLLKDLGAQAVDYPSHLGSKLYSNTRYRLNSAIYERLAAMGLVVFGRTAAPEHGIGPTSEAAVYGAPTRNPWDLTRTAGGSSGGSGAAVAGGIVPAAHGSDGGGSVRIPASNCGLVGFKATRARLPRGPYAGEGWGGMVVDGFLTRSLRDTAVLLDGTAGADLGAPYWAPPMEEGFLAAMDRAPGRLRVALCETSFTGVAVHADCRAAVQDAARLLEEMGHHVEPARPEAAETTDMMRAWTDIVACGTALAVKRTLAARGYGLRQGEIEPLTRGAIAHAEKVSGERYLDAVNTVHAYGRAMAAFMEGYDLLLTPTLAEPPALIGRFAHDTEDFDGYRNGPGMVFDYSPYTAAFNASGQPAASLPLWWTADGLPVGVHLAAGFGADGLLMSVCAELERARPWMHRRPPMVAAAG